MDTNEQRITCSSCAHYYITHDVNFRYGCRALDFKSARRPMLDVIASSGVACQYYRQKLLRPSS